MDDSHVPEASSKDARRRRESAGFPSIVPLNSEVDEETEAIQINREQLENKSLEECLPKIQH